MCRDCRVQRDGGALASTLERTDAFFSRLVCGSHANYSVPRDANYFFLEL